LQERKRNIARRNVTLDFVTQLSLLLHRCCYSASVVTSLVLLLSHCCYFIATVTLEEMEMGFKELEEEVDPQEKAATTEPMEDGGVDIERPTSTTSKAVPQEPTLTMELAEKINNTKTTK